MQERLPPHLDDSDEQPSNQESGPESLMTSEKMRAIAENHGFRETPQMVELRTKLSSINTFFRAKRKFNRYRIFAGNQTKKDTRPKAPIAQMIGMAALFLESLEAGRLLGFKDSVRLKSLEEEQQSLFRDSFYEELDAASFAANQLEGILPKDEWMKLMNDIDALYK